MDDKPFDLFCFYVLISHSSHLRFGGMHPDGSSRREIRQEGETGV